VIQEQVRAAQFLLLFGIREIVRLQVIVQVRIGENVES
jgi:hypothetical protein